MVTDKAYERFLEIPWFNLSVYECQERAIDLMNNYWDYQNRDKIRYYTSVVHRMETQGQIYKFMKNCILKGIEWKMRNAAKRRCEPNYYY